ncbi:MAG: enoyl-CoA hydratase/isomerase family protein, partial [Clostridia bacterium]
MSEHIIYHIADGIATLTLNRPKVLNAINYDLLKELDELLDQAAADDSLRVLILTG